MPFYLFVNLILLNVPIGQIMVLGEGRGFRNYSRRGSNSGSKGVSKQPRGYKAQNSLKHAENGHCLLRGPKHPKMALIS